MARVDPLVPGIDVVGTVSALGPGVHGVAIGDRVTCNGAGLGETRHGGWASHTVVPADALVVLPDDIEDSFAAAIGTAGFTAQLSVLALGGGGRPDDGPVLVTGASGGVGTVAIALLAARGYSVTASTGRVANADSLRRLGATDVVDRAALSDLGKPLQRATWAGAVDSVGGATLANVLAATRWGGAVTACGLAQDSALPTTVMPFILRAVSLLGVNSVEAPHALRQRRGTGSRPISTRRCSPTSPGRCPCPMRSASSGGRRGTSTRSDGRRRDGDVNDRNTATPSFHKRLHIDTLGLEYNTSDP